MDIEEIKKRLRTPQKVVREQARQAEAAKAQAIKAAPPKTWADKMPAVALGVTLAALVISLLFILSAKNKAENIPSSLDPANLKGLSVDREFNPSTGVRYVQIQEGQDRSVNVTSLGTTIPVISRYNFQTMNDSNYQTIGAAPWALTSNIESNAGDPEMVAFLLGKGAMIKAFTTRPDAANLLNDPEELRLFVEDTAAMDEFFQNETVRRVLGDEKLLTAISKSSFMGFLMVSKSGQYYRQNPQVAAKIINQNKYLSEMKKNPAVRRAVAGNPYLKKIAPILLK